MDVVTVLLVTCVMAHVSCAHNLMLDDMWTAFMKTHNKTYTTQEHKYRRTIWEEHVALVQKHNLLHDLGKVSYTMGINEYSDLSFEEYRHFLLGAKREYSQHKNSSMYRKFSSSYADPDEVDWRKEGYVTPIKNQGQCGSCWAFSSTGSMEGQHFRVTGKLIPLSEQQLVDCCAANAGCNGGWMDNAFDYVKTNGGIDTETYYPYQAHETGRCTFNPDPADLGSKCGGFVDVFPRSDEDALKSATAKMGPISVAIDAAHQSFQLYRGGVYEEPACSNKDTDHAVLVVGYGTENGQDYWLVKNSWGTTWGDQGYIKMARNKDNMCAIAEYASYPDM